jgi:ERI1 exoribonuclease 3
MLKIKQDPKLLVMDKDQSLYVSLETVKITGTIRSLVADVNITQVFRNDEKTLINAVYYFPIEKQETVYAFKACIDDREVVIQSKENNSTLNQDYDTGIMKEGSLVVDVGALPPSKECIITLTYATKLSFVDESTIQFVVPTNTNYLQINPYTVEFHCSIDEMNELKPQQKITQVSSASHPVQVHATDHDTYVINFVQQNTYLNRDILININLADTIVISQSNNTTVAKIITTNSVGQPFDYYCVLDFEAVCHQVNPSLKRPSPNDTWEIIEFPICLLESQTNTIIDTYHSYVRPTIKSSLNEICINITGITQDIVDNSPTFNIVWKDVQRFLSTHSLISLEANNSNLRSFTWITCGNWDLRTMLPLQLKQSGFDRPKFIDNFINLKDLYMEYYLSTRIRGMKDMLKKSNLLLEGRHHSGIDDTKNITRIAQWLIKNNKTLKLTWKGNK